MADEDYVKKEIRRTIEIGVKNAPDFEAQKQAFRDALEEALKLLDTDALSDYDGAYSVIVNTEWKKRP